MPGTRFSLEVRPRIPKRLRRLEELANDLFYSWDRGVRGLFFRLDRDLWETCVHNPKVFLRRVAQSKLESAAEDRIFVQDYNRVISAYDTYLETGSMPGMASILDPEKDLVAYFCAEFGFHESFPVYSGGLGILAGDHCKAASDLSFAFVGVGMLYRQGYFIQTIDGGGHQEAHYTQASFDDLPVVPALDPKGDTVKVHVDLPGRRVELKVWLAKAGHIRLFLLDSDLSENAESDRSITYQLYGGDINTRIQQEIVLGIGGVRALRAVGLRPTVWHINEGHAAFQILERCRECVLDPGLDFDTALEVIASETVFTTHTPVPAGHDIFDEEHIMGHFSKYITQLGIDKARFLSLGASPGEGHTFNMTALALRGSRYHNGVSRIHGRVASKMEGYIWPQIPDEENPIDHITNGVHVPTFLAREWANMFDMRFGGGWRSELLNEKFWEQIDDIPDQAFWTLRQTLKTELLEEAHGIAVRQHRRNGMSETQIERLNRHLDPGRPDILTLGFARRFATYKRATLLFADPDRLLRLLNDPDRPVVVLFAGKAHPNDQPGQELIRIIHEFSHRPGFEGKVILLEGYDMALARKLVTGVDVWLNTPEYPLEASGTSGQKAGINGAINLSVLDGWWGEGFDGENGWAIKPHDPRFDPDFRYREEATELMSILEGKVVPLYYERDDHGYSAGWIRVMKASMRSLIPRFNSQRMVMDYLRKFYGPASRGSCDLAVDNYRPARELSSWKRRVHAAWSDVRIRRIDHAPEAILSGDMLPIEVAASLNGLEATDVVVECLLGTESEQQPFQTDQRFEFAPAGTNKAGETLFRLDLVSALAGMQYYKIRVYPYHALLTHRLEMGYMLWI